jgi:SAM-dependent methyltransferase
MLINEAKWFGHQAATLPVESLSPLLNLGSQNAEFQEFTPWIEQYFLEPLRQRGVKIVNTDLQDAPGVDLVGDLLDPEFVNRIRTMGFRSAVCCNVLEHVLDRQAVAASVASLLPPGGYLFASCPHRFPFHPDPIDNGFRPVPSELAALFPQLRLMEGALVQCETGWEHLGQGPRSRAVKLARLALPFIRPRGWLDTLRMLAWSTRHFSAACTLLVRPG